tara:strand:+ start:368 stop:571 length:204 start_codon:yes stop_codon:yes gene_type:complete
MLKLVELNSNANSVLDNPANKGTHMTEVGDLGLLIDYSYDSGRTIYKVYFSRVNKIEHWFDQYLHVY